MQTGFEKGLYRIMRPNGIWRDGRWKHLGVDMSEEYLKCDWSHLFIDVDTHSILSIPGDALTAVPIEEAVDAIITVQDGVTTVQLVTEGDSSCTTTAFGKPTTKEPPLGIMPRCLWLEKRYEDVVNAINRFIAAKTNVPWEWVREYQWLFTELHNIEE